MTTTTKKPQGELGEIVVVEDADVMAKLKRRDVLKDDAGKINDGLRPIKAEVQGIDAWLTEEFPASKFKDGQKYRVGPYLLEGSTGEVKHVEFDRNPAYRVKVTLQSTD